MGPIAYSLCAKPVIGVVMFVTGQCAIPPLFDGVPIRMDRADATATARFKAPVDKSYPLLVTFTFADADARRRDVVIGERHDSYCDGRAHAQVPPFARDGLGRPIPLRIVVRAARDGTVVAERSVESLCICSHGPLDKSRHLTNIALRRGEYIAEVTNLAAQPELAGVRAELMLAGGMGK